MVQYEYKGGFPVMGTGKKFKLTAATKDIAKASLGLASYLLQLKGQMIMILMYCIFASYSLSHYLRKGGKFEVGWSHVSLVCSMGSSLTSLQALLTFPYYPPPSPNTGPLHA